MESDSRSFALKIGFKPNTSDPGRIFRAMNELIYCVEGIDSLLASVVSADVESELILEDVKSGSLVSLFRQNVKTKSDSLYNTDSPKKKIEDFLNRSNKEIFKSISNGDTDYSKIEDMIERLNEMAKETDVLKLDGYGRVKISDITSYLEGLSDAIDNLSEGDSASYIGVDNEEISIDLGLSIEEDEVMEEVSGEKIVNENEMILRVKKPDYIGNSQWIFKHRTGTFRAKINDEEWLESFQEREKDLRPGDSVRAIVEIKTVYDNKGEVISEDRSIKKVKDIMRQDKGDQKNLDL